MSQPTISTIPYLNILKTELATSLMPADDSARKVAIYGHRMLTVLLLRLQTLPALQQKALLELSGLLDELIAALGSIEGGMVLIPQLVFHIRSQPDYAAAEPFLQSAVRLLATSPGAAADKLQAGIARITCGIQETFNQAALDQDIKPSATQSAAEPLSNEQKLSLQNYLRNKFPAESGLKVGSSKAIVGGGSKQTLIVELSAVSKLPPAVVLRMDKAEGVVDSTVVDEYQLIKTVYEAGVPAPQPIAVESDKAVLGAPFIVVSRVAGHNIGDWIEVTEPSRTFAVGLARTLAKLHQIPLQGAGDRLPGAQITTRERMQQEIDAFEKTWRAYGEPSIALEQAYAWLRRHMAFAEGQRSIIHCDVGCHNMLGKDGELTALLDWETAVIGNPAQDLAYTRHLVVQMMPWEEYLDEYAKAGGIVPGDAELDFYRLWRGVFTMHYQFMARSFFLSGMSSSLIHAYATQHLHLRCDFHLHETVKLVYEKY